MVLNKLSEGFSGKETFDLAVELGEELTPFVYIGKFDLSDETEILAEFFDPAIRVKAREIGDDDNADTNTGLFVYIGNNFFGIAIDALIDAERIVQALQLYETESEAENYISSQIDIYGTPKDSYKG